MVPVFFVLHDPGILPFGTLCVFPDCDNAGTERGYIGIESGFLVCRVADSRPCLSCLNALQFLFVRALFRVVNRCLRQQVRHVWREDGHKKRGMLPHQIGAHAGAEPVEEPAVRILGK